MLIIKLLLVVAFIGVFWQDITTRKIYWFWLPVIAGCCGILLWKQLPIALFLTSVLINLTVVLILLAVVWLYCEYKLKMNIKDTFGLGDTLLFIALIFSFTPVVFIILLVFGLICTLILHLSLKHKSKYNTVPLAGYLSLFFALAYIANWLGFLNTMYQF